MKISMMSYTMARGVKKGEPFDVKALCQFTRDLKLDAVDWCSTYGHDPREVRKMMDDFGLKTCCYTFGCDFNFSAEYERAPAREKFQKGLEAAVLLGTDKIMLPVSGKEGRTRGESFRNVVNGIREVIGLADKAGVTVTIENFPNYLSPFISSADVNHAVAELPQLRITFDNGNVTTSGESAYDGFKNSAKWVVHAHFKDYKICAETDRGAMRCLDGKFRRATLVGDGDVDQLGGLRAMKEAGYQDYINFEYEGSDLTPHDATITGIRRMRQWIASLG